MTTAIGLDAVSTSASIMASVGRAFAAVVSIMPKQPTAVVVELGTCVACGRQVRSRAPRTVCDRRDCREAWRNYLACGRTVRAVDQEIIRPGGPRFPPATFRHLTTRDPIEFAGPSRWRRP